MPEPQKRKPRRRKSGDLRQLQNRVWNALLHAESTLEAAAEARNHELVLRSIHGVSQIGGLYLKCLQEAEFEQRLQEVEREQRRLAEQHQAWWQGRGRP